MTREKMISLQSIDPERATGDAAEVLGRARAQVGFIPNMYTNMAHQPGLLDSYLHGYQLFREKAGLSPAEQEVVFLAISIENHCEYCVTAHSMLAAKKSGVPATVLDALRNGTAIDDPKLAALARFTTQMVVTRGNPGHDEIKRFLDAGYREPDILAIVLAISVKILSNYSNHLFNTEVDGVFADYSWPE